MDPKEMYAMHKSCMVILTSLLTVERMVGKPYDSEEICLDDMEAEIYNMEEEIKVMRERINRLMEDE